MTRPLRCKPRGRQTPRRSSPRRSSPCRSSPCRPSSGAQPSRLSQYAICPQTQAQVQTQAQAQEVQGDITRLDDMEGGAEFRQALEILYQIQPIRYLVLEAATLVMALHTALDKGITLDQDLLKNVQDRLNKVEQALRFCYNCPAQAWPDKAGHTPQ